MQVIEWGLREQSKIGSSGKQEGGRMTQSELMIFLHFYKDRKWDFPKFRTFCWCLFVDICLYVGQNFT